MAWHSGTCRFFAYDNTGNLQWEYSGAGCEFGMAPSDGPMDSSGNLFVEYTTGRYSRVTVLSPTEDGFESFGSLPGGEGWPTSMRFYDSRPYDVEDDGTREIIRVNRSCDPSCADGPVTFSTFAWNGSDYFTELCTSPQRPPLAIQATSGAGGTVMGQIPAGTCEVYSNVSEYINEVEWNAVWFADVSGWAPAASFQPAPSEPPYPVEENEVVEITAPAPPPAPNELLPPGVLQLPLQRPLPASSV